MGIVKLYKAEIIGQKVIKNKGQENEKTVISYVRNTKLTENDKKANREASRMMTIQLSETSSLSPYGGMPQAKRIAVFENSHGSLFSTLLNHVMEIQEKTKAGEESELGFVLKTGNIQLTNPFPGRWTERRSPMYYMVDIDPNTGAEKPRVVETKDPKTGIWTSKPGIANKISFFLFENEATSDDGEEIRFNAEWNRISHRAVSPTSEDSDNPSSDSKKEEDKTETKKVAEEEPE